MHHTTIEQIQVAATPRVTGRLNVYFAVAALVLVVAAPHRLAYAGALACFGALGVDAGGRDYLGVLRLPVYFLAPTLALIAVFTPGPAAVSVGPLAVSWPGIQRTLTTGLRSLSSVTILSYLIVTTPVPEVVGALQSLRCPRFVVDVSLLTYRAIQTLFDELARLELAASSRLGFRTRRTTLATSKALAFSLFVRSLSRADALDDAMQARGYDGALPTPTTPNTGYGYVGTVLVVLAVTGWGV